MSNVRHPEGDREPIIGVMVLNWNGRGWLGPLFDSLRRQGYSALKIYLVDNGSSDDSVAFTLAKYPEVRVLRFSKNFGYCMAYNMAMPHAFADGCEWVVWANNDILLEPGCLAELAAAAADQERIGVLGPAFLAWDSDEPNYYMTGKHPDLVSPMLRGDAEPVDVDWVEGSFLMVRAECVEDVGWLDPFLSFYWEETDFCRRALRKEWRVALVPRARARHFAGGWASASGATSETANRLEILKARNQYIFTLADPNRSFVSNLVGGVHLFLVLAKAALSKSARQVRFEWESFCRIIPELGAIHAKWQRDRKGISPPQVTPEHTGVALEAVGGLDGTGPRAGR